MTAVRGRVAARQTEGGEAEVLSYYRHHAQQCQIAAQNAPNIKQRAELQKMVQVWIDFAEDHERMMRDSANGQQPVVRRRSVRGWM